MALGRKDFSPDTRIAANIEYLSNYVYRLVFNDNYWQAVSSQVKSDVVLQPNRTTDFMPSLPRTRPEIRRIERRGRGPHPPPAQLAIRCARRLWERRRLYWGLGSSHWPSRSLRIRIPCPQHRPLRSVPASLHAHRGGTDGASCRKPHCAPRTTAEARSRSDRRQWRHPRREPRSFDAACIAEASLDVRPPALERDFSLGVGARVLRHVIEPELRYHFVGGIGSQAREHADGGYLRHRHRHRRGGIFH